MKLKNLTKKIRRLEARIQKDAKKVAKLKRKLGAARIAATAKAKKKSVPPTAKARKEVKVSAPTRATPTDAAKPVAKKVKRKLNLTPERRAQLAAAMKARWAAKKAAAAPTTQDASADRGFAVGDAAPAGL